MALDRTLIQIRERSYSDILDLALVVVRSRPKAVGLAALGGALPFLLLNQWLLNDEEFPPFFFLGLLWLEAPWATAPLTIVLAGLMFGEKPTVRKVASTLIARAPAMLVYQLILRAVLFTTVVLIPLLPARLAFLNEVILLERGKFSAVIRRCSTLCGRRGSDLFGQFVASSFFGALFVVCFWFGTNTIGSALITSSVTWDEPGWRDLIGWRFQIGVWIAITFFGVARFFTYIDQRIRLEGWEVKLRLQAVGRSLEEAAR